MSYIKKSISKSMKNYRMSLLCMPAWHMINMSHPPHNGLFFIHTRLPNPTLMKLHIPSEK